MADLIKLDFNTSPLLKAKLNLLVRKGKNLTQPMKEIGEIAETSIRYNFEVGGRYSGSGENVAGGSKKWDALSVGYYDWKVNVKNSSPLPLTLDSGLVNSIQKTNINSTGVDLSTSKEYAAAHHFGHEFTANRILPERPFMVIQDDDIEDFFDVLRAHFQK